jgi:hypothetical protein
MYFIFSSLQSNIIVDSPGTFGLGTGLLTRVEVLACQTGGPTLNMTKRFWGIAAVASLLMLGTASFAQADVVATLAFTDAFGNPDPGGIVGPTDSIPVWLTLTLAADSDPLITDPSSLVTSPVFDYSTLNYNVNPPQAPDPSTDNFSVYVNEDIGCSGTFTTGCTTGPPYDFTFNYGPTPNAFVTPANFDLTAGGSYTWELGTFTPTGGSAPAGTYTLPSAGVAFYVYDDSILTDGSTVCSSPGPGCSPELVAIQDVADTNNGPAFTRTVVSAPEPAAVILLATMLLGIAFMARNRIDQAARPNS